MMPSVIVLGAGGHAKVIIDSLCQRQRSIACLVVESSPETPTSLFDAPILSESAAMQAFRPGQHLVANGIGIQPKDGKRMAVVQHWEEKGYRFISVIHPTATVSQFARIRPGSQVLERAVVQVASLVGEHCIINTAAVVEHDCELADHVHIAPGAILCGGVRVGEGAFIGAGAVIKQGVQIGAHSVVAAGAVVLRDVAAATTVMGVPARRQYDRMENSTR